MTGQEAARIPLQLSRGSVVASVQVELGDETLARFRFDLLRFVHSTGASSVVLDVSGIKLMDLDDFQQLMQTLEMARVMGKAVVVAGLQATVVSALVDLGASSRGIQAAGDLDHAFSYLSSDVAGH